MDSIFLISVMRIPRSMPLARGNVMICIEFFLPPFKWLVMGDPLRWSALRNLILSATNPGGLLLRALFGFGDHFPLG